MTDKLTKFEKGEKVKITKIEAGKRALAHLMNMGIFTGNIVQITRASSLKGPVVISHLDSEIALGHGLAGKIFAEKIQ